MCGIDGAACFTEGFSDVLLFGCGRSLRGPSSPRARRARCLMNARWSLLDSAIGLARGEVLLVAVYELSVSRLGRILRVSPRARRARCLTGVGATGWPGGRFDSGVQVGLRFHVVGPPYSTTGFLMGGRLSAFSVPLPVCCLYGGEWPCSYGGE